ncbi:MAG: HDOD domain-containing protein [Desulfobacteraceae bacterium]|nr:HDOD domain-containing protein [Desulfobacteraceae bacterium]
MNTHHALENWVERLLDENMPLFIRTVESVANIADREDSSFSDLAWSILKDPTLTAQVLKVSNSIYYNPGAMPINTVSRAVMRLGFDTVKVMCLSIALVEAVVDGLHRQKVAIEMARAFHSAVQAKNLAITRQLAVPEEVFIAALLSRIGHIAFWCFADEIGAQLEQVMQDAQNEDEAEIEVLGFKLERLTLRLSQEWKLSKLLETVLQRPNSKDPRSQSIRLGYEIAKSSEGGWDSINLKKTAGYVCEFLNLPENEVMESLQESARNAAEITESYGAGMSSRLIPIPGPPIQEPVSLETPKREFPEPDIQVQLSSLRDLSSLVSKKKADVNVVLSILLEGIYRGVGMDRVIFTLLSIDREFLQGKYGLGWESENFVSDFRIAVDSSRPNIFSDVLKAPRALWVTEDPEPEILSLLTREMSNLLGTGPFLIMPIAIKNRAIGIIYADRRPSGRELDEESFDNFSFFGQQANMNLTTLTGQ